MVELALTTLSINKGWIYYFEWDIPLQFIGGILGVVLGYCISTLIRKPKDKREYLFCGCFSFFFSCTLIIIRKVLQFFIDFFTGSNLTRHESVSDDHWFFRLFGFGMSPWEQRPLMDMGEDFIMGVIGSLIGMGSIFFYIRLRHKELFSRSKKNMSDLFKGFPERFRNKIEAEKIKLGEQTNIFDILIWWCVRSVMIYAFITWDNRAEATLLSANLLGTFAISLIHLIFPEDSFLCRINYRVQTLITAMVFMASYCGNYVFVYGILPRYDLFLHFISGAVAAAAGYYFALTLIKPETKTDNTLIAIFTVTFSLMIIPIHEMIEFIGDFIWGTSNQGFYWGPADDSFFFKLFGYGVRNTQLYYLFDTMYDALLASSTTLLTVIVVYSVSERNRKRLRKESNVQKVKIFAQKIN